MERASRFGPVRCADDRLVQRRVPYLLETQVIPRGCDRRGRVSRHRRRRVRLGLRTADRVDWVACGRTGWKPDLGRQVFAARSERGSQGRKGTSAGVGGTGLGQAMGVVRVVTVAEHGTMDQTLGRIPLFPHDLRVVWMTGLWPVSLALLLHWKSEAVSYKTARCSLLFINHRLPRSFLRLLAFSVHRLSEACSYRNIHYRCDRRLAALGRSRPTFSLAGVFASSSLRIHLNRRYDDSKRDRTDPTVRRG